MLFIKNQAFALLGVVVTAVVTSTNVNVVSAAIEGGRVAGGGGIRGAKKLSSSSSFPQELQEVEQQRQRRHLKEDNKNTGGGNNNVVAAPTAPVPVSPTEPPVLTGPAEWAARCSRERNAVNNCSGGGRTPEACHNCLYSQNLNTAQNINGCMNYWCGTSDQCRSAATDMFNCGARIVNIVPTPAPVAPVAPVTAATPAPAPLAADTGSSTCSTTVPKSGDACTAGAGNAYNTCCYQVDYKNGLPAPAGYAHVCTCAAYENRYLCNDSTTNNLACTSLITPGNPVSAPTNVPAVVTAAPVVPAVVAEPTAAPVVPAVVVAPTDVPAATPAVPTLMPLVPAAGTPEPVVPGQGVPGCPAGKIQDGASCEVPEGRGAVGCGFEETTGTPPNDLTITMYECVCDTAAPSLTWACQTLQTTTPAPAPPSAAPPSVSNTFCPAQDDVPGDNTSCEGILPVAITEGTCMFMQQTTGGPLETKTCTCVLDNPVWSCTGGSFSPVQAPVSLMPAGEIQPSSIEPVPTTPVSPGETTTCPTTFPGDGTSCEGVLKGGLSNASCNFSQTITTNGVAVNEFATCGCSQTDEIWSCQGSLSPAPPNAVPADTPPAPVPTDIISGVPAPTESPQLLGADYCTFGPDPSCYETNGKPKCCSNDSICPEQKPECDVPTTPVPDVGEDQTAVGEPDAPTTPVPDVGEDQTVVGEPESQEQEQTAAVGEPESEIAVTLPAPTATNVSAVPASYPIPDSVDFSSGSNWCPQKIENCSPCADSLPAGSIEGSCDQLVDIEYENQMVTVEIQCRCPLQEIQNPTWNCRFIGGDGGSILVPAAPLCPAPEYDGPDDFGVGPSFDDGPEGGPGGPSGSGDEGGPGVPDDFAESESQDDGPDGFGVGPGFEDGPGGPEGGPDGFGDEGGPGVPDDFAP